MAHLITTHEASVKYQVSTAHLRRLAESGAIEGRKAKLNRSKEIWLIEESSLKHYKAQKLKPGRKPKKTR